MYTYRYLIFDVDDTLLDFHAAYRDAQRSVAEKLGIEYSEKYKELSETCGWRAWNENGLNHTERKDVQDNYHLYYKNYLKNHYLYLADTLGIETNVNEVVGCYLNSISSSKRLKESDSLEVYKQLAEHYKLAVATNGIERVQKARLSEFLPYTERIYISEAIGTIKPSKAFYEYVLRDLQCDPKECLMIGDSITNDIIGAKDAGMDVCFYNPRQKSMPEGIVVDYEIRKLRQLIDILCN